MDRFDKIVKDEKVLVLMPFGSRLYGTETPESDLDYKGVFLPTKRETLLGQIRPRITHRPEKGDGEKNKPGDIDFELLSLHEFIRLALEGQTMALDMLHAKSSVLIHTTPVWETLAANRKRFHTKNLKAFVGYARRQAAKYGVKGSRLACGKAWLNTLESYRLFVVSSLVDDIESGHLMVKSGPDLWEHARLTGVEDAPLEILGRRLTAGASCSHYIPMLEKYVDDYGERARLAARNEGIDWKALSHAIRAALEVHYILTDGDFELPFGPVIAGHLRDIKLGRSNFSDVQEQLEETMDEIEELAEASSLPAEPDRKWAEDFIVRVMS